MYSIHLKCLSMPSRSNLKFNLTKMRLGSGHSGKGHSSHSLAARCDLTGNPVASKVELFFYSSLHHN